MVYIKDKDIFENNFNSLGEKFEDPVFCIDKSTNVFEHQQFPDISFFNGAHWHSSFNFLPRTCEIFKNTFFTEHLRATASKLASPKNTNFIAYIY